MYKMFIITEKMARVKGMEEILPSFVSKSIREYFAKPSSELIELSNTTSKQNTQNNTTQNKILMHLLCYRL